MAGVRGRWTRAQAREVVEELEASGLSAAEFARRRGVNVERVRRWRQRLRPRKAAEGMPRLVELVPRQEVVRGRLQIRCPSGHVIEIDNVELDGGLLAALAAIDGVSRC